MPGPKRRKLRMLRPEEVADDRLVLIRAAPMTAAATLADITDDALASARAYSIETEPGHREQLVGVSVFARRPGVDLTALLARFDEAPAFLETTVAVLRASGFTVWPTGSNIDHFDLQLLPGLSEDDVVSAETVRRAAGKLLSISGDLRPNPAYAGERSGRFEEL